MSNMPFHPCALCPFASGWVDDPSGIELSQQIEWRIASEVLTATAGPLRHRTGELLALHWSTMRERIAAR